MSPFYIFKKVSFFYFFKGNKSVDFSTIIILILIIYFITNICLRLFLKIIKIMILIFLKLFLKSIN